MNAFRPVGDSPDDLKPAGTVDFQHLIDDVCGAYRATLETGGGTPVDELLLRLPVSLHASALGQLAKVEREWARMSGQFYDSADFIRRFPQFSDSIEAVLSNSSDSTFSTTEQESHGSPGSSVVDPYKTIPPPDAVEQQGTAPIRKLGRFELLELLGQGAFGSVYRARDPQLDREVAIKIPRAGTLHGNSSARRFLREARAAAQLRHPNIVPVHDAGQIDGTYYIASSFIRGCTLREKLLSGRQYSEDEAAVLVAKLAAAFHYVHLRGIIHRDIKPENIMIDESGEPLVMGFGLARRSEGEELLTREGVQMGTAAYMSPEQARGESHLADARSDLWSLGVVLYELIVGQRPFCGKTFDALTVEILHRNAPAPRTLRPAISKDSDAICQKCLAKEPNNRYASCELLAEELTRVARREPITTRRITTLERTWRSAKRHPAMATMIALSFLLLTVLAIGGPLAALRQMALTKEKANAVLLADEHAAVAEKNANAANEANNREKSKREEAEKLLRLTIAQRLAAEGQRALADGFAQRSALLAIESIQSSRKFGEPVVSEAEQLLRDSMALIPDGVRLPVGSAVTAIDLGAAIPSPHWADYFSNKRFGTPRITTGFRRFQPRFLIQDLPYLDKPPDVPEAQVSPSDPRSARWLAVGRHDGTIRLWDLAEGTDPEGAIEIKIPGTIACFAISPDQNWLAAAGGYGNVKDVAQTVCVWDLNAIKTKLAPHHKIDVHGGLFNHLAITSDNHALICADNRGALHVWKLPTLAPVATDLRHGEVVEAIAIHPDGKSFASDSRDGTIRLWDLTASNVSTAFRVLTKKRKDTGALAFSPDGRRLAYGSGPQIWDLTAKEPDETSVVIGDSGFSSLAVSPDGHWMLGAGYSGVCYWDLQSNNPTTEQLKDLSADKNHAKCIVAAPDGAGFLVAMNNVVRRVTIEGNRLSATSDLLLGHELDIKAMALNEEGDKLFTGSDDGTVQIWNLASNARSDNSTKLHKEASVGALLGIDRCLSGDGRWYVDIPDHPIGEERGVLLDLFDSPPTRHELKTYDTPVRRAFLENGGRWLATIDDGNAIAMHDLTADDPSSRLCVIGQEEDSNTNVVVSHDGRWLATVGQHLSIWNRQAEQATRVRKNWGDNLGNGCPVLFSPDGRWLVVITEFAQRLNIWDLSSGNLDEPRFVIHIDQCFASGFSPDSKRLAIASIGGPIILLDMTANQLAESAFRLGKQQHGFARSLTISKSNRWLVAGFTDHTVQLWDLKNAQPDGDPAILMGHQDTVNCVRFSHDERFIVSGSNDNTARVWGVSSEEHDQGRSSLILRGTAAFNDVAMSHDGKWLTGVDIYDGLWRWNIDLDDLLNTARARIGRELTTEERSRYGLEPAARKDAPD